MELGFAIGSGHITFHTSDPKLLKDNNLLPLKHKGQTQKKASRKSKYMKWELGPAQGSST